MKYSYTASPNYTLNSTSRHFCTLLPPPVSSVIRGHRKVLGTPRKSLSILARSPPSVSLYESRDSDSETRHVGLCRDVCVSSRAHRDVRNGGDEIRQPIEASNSKHLSSPPLSVFPPCPARKGIPMSCETFRFCDANFSGTIPSPAIRLGVARAVFQFII